MKKDVSIIPETEEELKLVEMLAEVREYAIQDAGMEPEEVAALFAQFSAGAIEGEFVGDQTDRVKCPNCGEPVEDVESMGLGMTPELEPCGCEVEYTDIPDDLYL